jgi:hypothetical protein
MHHPKIDFRTYRRWCINPPKPVQSGYAQNAFS